MTWADDAQRAIAKIMAEMPAEATLEERRKELRRHSHSFTGGTSWGAKIWPRECRRYLAAHFNQGPMTPASGVEKLRALGPQHDIIFPFREERSAP